MKNINKIAFGFTFYAASTLFVYFLISYCTSLEVVENVFGQTMNVVYAILSLSISLIIQIKFLKFKDSRTLLIFGIINIIAYLLVLVLAIYINLGGLKTNKFQFVAASIGLYIYSGIEMLCGITQVVKSIKLDKIENNKSI